LGIIIQKQQFATGRSKTRPVNVSYRVKIGEVSFWFSNVKKCAASAGQSKNLLATLPA
jgi:hypothetical protein